MSLYNCRLSIMSNLESNFEPIFKGSGNQDKIRKCFDKRQN